MKQITLNRMVATLAVLTVLGCGGSATMTQTVAPSPTPNVKFIPTDNTIHISGIKNVAVAEGFGTFKKGDMDIG